MPRVPCQVSKLYLVPSKTVCKLIADVNSIYDCGDYGGEADMDDTSLSSRASSRIFDSDQIYSAESMHGM